MLVSEHKKLGVKAEHVPIKKRRFLYRSPSPPLSPRCNSPCLPENDKNSECDLGQDSLMRCQDAILGKISDSNVVVSLKLEKIDNNVDENADFSGISILAAAACSINSELDDKLQWDLNMEMGAVKCDISYQDVDCIINVTDTVSKCSDDGALTDMVENNKESGSPYLSDTCDANPIDLTGDYNTHQIIFSAHDNVDSDVPQNDHAFVGGVEVQQTCELQLDYDSQYEDGELKDSIEQTWEEYVIKDGEAELVSHGSVDREIVGFDSVNHRVTISEGAGPKKYQFNDTNSSSSGEDFSLKNVQKANHCESNTCHKFDEKTDSDKLILTDKFHRHNDVDDSYQPIDLNYRQIGWDVLCQSFKRSPELASRVGGFRVERDLNRDRIDSEDKVFGSREINREFRSRANDLENRGMFLRKDRTHGSRFNEVDGSESRYRRDWGGNHQSFGAGNRPIEQNWRQNTNNADMHIKRVRSPGGSPTFHRGRSIRNYGARFDNRGSNYSRHLPSHGRSFSPAENLRDFHSDRAYAKNLAVSHDFRSRERAGRGKSPQFPTRYIQRSSVLDGWSCGGSDSPENLKQNNYSRVIHHGSFSRSDGSDHRYKENADQRHGYRYKHNFDNRHHDSDQGLKSIRYSHEDDFGGAAMRKRDKSGSFSHRRDREFDAI